MAALTVNEGFAPITLFDFPLSELGYRVPVEITVLLNSRNRDLSRERL